MNEIKQSLMTYEIYNKSRHPVPYFFKIEKNGQVIYYFGANHSRNSNDKQYKQIKKYWKEFCKITEPEKSIVGVEGGLRVLEKSDEEAILKGAEASFITRIANIDGYATFCPEPNPEVERSKIASKYNVDELQYYYFARVVNQWGMIPTRPDFESYMLSFFQEDEFESNKKFHKTLFKSDFEEKNTDFFYAITNPCFETTVINSISREISSIRDSFIVHEILEKWNEGKNLFIVFGHTHAVMQEPALRKLTKK